MSTQAGVAVRVFAAKVIDAVHRGRSLKAELAATLPKIADVRDRALLEAICFTALRQRARYDVALKSWLQKPLGANDGELRALLLAGFAQLDELKLPAHAALSATVEAARTLGRPHQAGMVNAILRRAQREGLPQADASAAWPAWLRRKIEADWPAFAGEIFANSARPAPLWLRVNRRKLSRDAYAEKLDELGLNFTIDEDVADGIRIDEPVAVHALPGFDAGEISVQDGSAQLCADALAPDAQSRVLDACAAPGGKTMHLLERDASLRLLALDVDARRLQRVGENLARAGLHAELKQADAADLPGWWNGEFFDSVLLDAPCSATGIVRRQPDVLLHRREVDIAALVALQAKLLDALWKTLRPGGMLLYATCSLLKDENERQVDAFLARMPDARAELLDARFGHASGAGRQCLPGEAGRDGFFYARLQKIGNT